MFFLIGFFFVTTVAVTGYLLMMDELIKKLREKNVAIFGEKASGKTTLHSFLRKGVIPSKYDGTTRKPVKGGEITLGDLNLVLSEGMDIGGGDEFVGEWKKIFLSSHICFYLFNCSKVISGDKDYTEKVERHLSHIYSWTKEKEKPPKIFLFGTWADKIEGFEDFFRGNKPEFEENFRTILKKAMLNANIKASALLAGSLKNEEYAKVLIFRWLEGIQKDEF